MIPDFFRHIVPKCISQAIPLGHLSASNRGKGFKMTQSYNMRKALSERAQKLREDGFSRDMVITDVKAHYKWLIQWSRCRDIERVVRFTEQAIEDNPGRAVDMAAIWESRREARQDRPNRAKRYLP